MTRFRLVFREFPQPSDVLGGVAVYDPLSGRYVIMINDLKPDDEKIRTLKHELAHIVLGHLQDDRTETDQIYLDNLDPVEDEADQYADDMTDERFTELMEYEDRIIDYDPKIHLMTREDYDAMREAYERNKRIIEAYQRGITNT